MRLAGYRLRGLRAGAATALLTLAVLTAASTSATAADPAYTETEIERVIPLTVSVLHPCTGEPVVLRGHLLFLYHLTSNGTHFTVSEQTKTQGVTGVNPITGVKYVSSDVDTFTVSVQNLGGAATGQQSWLFSRSGESAPADDDFYFRLLIHFSTNAAGTPTAEVDDFSMECR